MRRLHDAAAAAERVRRTDTRLRGGPNGADDSSQPLVRFSAGGRLAVRIYTQALDDVIAGAMSCFFALP